MRVNIKLVVILFLFAILLYQPAQSCTSFVISKDHALIFGANLDFPFGEGFIFINKRNVSKEGYLQSTTGKTADWISKYGSITFNLVGKEFAWCGINEAGLVVSTMWLKKTILSEPDSRPPCVSGFWVQYQLDNHKSIDDVIACDSIIRLADDPCHFLVCDSTGACASIEFLNGKMVCHTREKMPIKVLTNIPYSEALSYAKKSLIPENDPEDQSIYRFITVAEKIERYDPDSSISSINYAMNILTETVFRPHTRWSIVFDINAKQIVFRTTSNKRDRSLNIDMFDLSCNSPVLMLDVNANIAGNITNSFTGYSHQSNLELFNNFCSRFGISVSADESLELVQFLESYPCKK